MHFGIIEYVPGTGLREKNGVSSRRHGITAYPEELSVKNNPSLFDVIYFTAFVPGTVVFELAFPAPLTGRNLRSALLFELERRIPTPLEEITYGYLRSSRNDCKFRVYAVRRNALTELFEQLRAAGLSCDCFLPAQLLIPPDADEVAGLSPAELLWRHLERDYGGRDLHLSVEPIPRELRPVRHRKWRKVFNVVFTVSVLLTFLLLGIRLQQAMQELRALQAENRRLAARLKEVQTVKVDLVRARELNEKLRSAQFGTTSVLAILNDLNGRLPNSMYLDGYNQTGNQVDVVIRTKQIDPNLPRLLLSSPLYQGEIKKTVQNADDSAVYNVSLKEVQP